MKALRIGVNVSPSVSDDAVAQARLAEELGFDFVSVNDHLHGSWSRHETWTLLSWIAASTKRIHVLPRVLSVPFRSPAVVAKMAETFDRLSGGRLILGLGAGASEEEFDAFGAEPRTAAERFAGLEDAIAIARGLWSRECLTHDGAVYRTREARIEPKAERAIPIWLGVLGPKGLALAGRAADGWIPSYELAPPQRVPELRARILDAAAAIGRDSTAFTCAYNLEVRIDAQARTDETTVAGDAAAVAEQLRMFAALGFDAFNVILAHPDELRRFAGEVMPLLRR